MNSASISCEFFENSQGESTYLRLNVDLSLKQLESQMKYSTNYVMKAFSMNVNGPIIHFARSVHLQLTACWLA